MKSILHWAVNNAPAMNTLMIAVLLVGAGSFWAMRREVFPEFDLEIILVTVPYPGASPAEIEEGICQKIEEAVRSVDGIKKITSVAQENAGSVILELFADVPDVQRVLGEVRSEVDRIPTLPPLAEDPDVKQITLRDAAIRVGVVGPEDDSPEGELRLREVTEQVRDDLLRLDVVSQANLMGARDFQIDIEIPEPALRRYGLSLRKVAEIVRRHNLELPGGTIRTDTQELLLRGKHKYLRGSEIAHIPLVTDESGVVLTVGDLGTVRDEFADITAINRLNGKPGLVISVDRTKNEDLLAMTETVHKFIADKHMPAGYELVPFADRSVDVRDRMELLTRNGLQGLILVFIVLAIFLDLKLAFWVALGIPIAVMGAGGVLFLGGETLNMLSMFAFLMALGIVVDDAIVVGENVFEHRQRGKSYVQAAVDGTREVLPSVFASVCTTIIAFVPLMFVSGMMGKFIAVLPVAVIAMLIISLIESTFVLPCHLAHKGSLIFTLIYWVFYPFRFLLGMFRWLNVRVTSMLHWVIHRTYLPTLRWSLGHPATVLAAATALLIAAVGLVKSDRTPFVVMPKLDSNWIEAKVTYPDGTPDSVTDAATRRIEQAIQTIGRENPPEAGDLVQVVYRAVGQVASTSTMGSDARTDGSHLGTVLVELISTAHRTMKSHQIVDRWREISSPFPGAEKVTFGVPAFGPGGRPIEFKLLAPPEKVAMLEQAVEKCKAELARREGVFDVGDDSQPGKWEFQPRLKKSAESLGISRADLFETVRHTYYGEEVMRLQRGRHEVKLMVRYPRQDRRSLAMIEEIRVRDAEGVERPITEVADFTIDRGYSEINRVDQMRSITVTADLDESRANARKIVADMRKNFMPGLLAEYPGLAVRWEGQQQQSEESVQSMAVGFAVAMVAMFVLLTLEFRSYFQPFLVLFIIPFAAIGAILGHWAMGMPLTIFTLFGMVALAGVVVNDSIVLIDFINHRIRDGVPLREALMDAGRRRFRPVLLTSVTTIAGLLPILTERSFQAQILIPMAATLCFGLLLGTALILVLVPTFYYVYYRAFIGRPAAAEDEFDAATGAAAIGGDGRPAMFLDDRRSADSRHLAGDPRRETRDDAPIPVEVLARGNGDDER